MVNQNCINFSILIRQYMDFDDIVFILGIFTKTIYHKSFPVSPFRSNTDNIVVLKQLSQSFYILFTFREYTAQVQITFIFLLFLLGFFMENPFCQCLYCLHYSANYIFTSSTSKVNKKYYSDNAHYKKKYMIRR